MAETLIFAGDPAAIEVLLAETGNIDLQTHPRTCFELVTLEGPTERLQKLLVTRLKTGDLSTAALVSSYCDEAGPDGSTDRASKLAHALSRIRDFRPS